MTKLLVRVHGIDGLVEVDARKRRSFYDDPPTPKQWVVDCEGATAILEHWETGDPDLRRSSVSEADGSPFVLGYVHEVSFDRRGLPLDGPRRVLSLVEWETQDGDSDLWAIEEFPFGVSVERASKRERTLVS